MVDPIRLAIEYRIDVLSKLSTSNQACSNVSETNTMFTIGWFTRV